MTPPGVHPLGRSLTQTRPPPLPLLLLQLLPPLPPPPTRTEVAVVAAEAGAAEHSGTSTLETRGDRRRRRHCPQLGPGPTCWRAAKAAARSPWSPLPLLPPPPPGRGGHRRPPPLRSKGRWRRRRGGTRSGGHRRRPLRVQGGRGDWQDRGGHTPAAAQPSQGGHRWKRAGEVAE